MTTSTKYIFQIFFFAEVGFACVPLMSSDMLFFSSSSMSDKSELKAELERKKQRIAQIREEKKRKEEEKKKKDVSDFKQRFELCSSKEKPPVCLF